MSILVLPCCLLLAQMIVTARSQPIHAGFVYCPGNANLFFCILEHNVFCIQYALNYTTPGCWIKTKTYCRKYVKVI